MLRTSRDRLAERRWPVAAEVALDRAGHLSRGHQSQLVTVPLHRLAQWRIGEQVGPGILEPLPGQPDRRAQLSDTHTLVGGGPQHADDVRCELKATQVPRPQGHTWHVWL